MEHFVSKDKWCVYYHRNRISNKYYVGITKDPKKRWNSKGKGYKGCPHLQNAIQKYGWNNFDHVILLSGLEKEQAKQVEIYLINKFDLTNPENGYNISKGGDTGSGLCGDNHPRIKYYPKVYKVGLDGKLQHIYDDFHVIDGFTKNQCNRIKECCIGNMTTAYNSFWLFEPDYNEENIKKLMYKNANKYEKTIKKVCVYSESGKLIKTFANRFQAADFTKIKPTSITAACCKEYHHCGDYLFYYYEQTQGRDVEPWRNIRFRSVLRFHNGTFIERFSSLKDAESKHGCSVKAAVRSVSHIAYGDQWVFEDEYDNVKCHLNLQDIGDSDCERKKRQ